MAYQKGKLNQEFLSVASLGNNQPTGIIQKATDGYAKNAYGKPIDNGGFLTELNLLGKSEQNKEEVNEYSISGYSEVVKSENLTSFEDKTETINGVTYTYNRNTITATGTATGNSNRNMSKIKLPAGTYNFFIKYKGTLPSEYVGFAVYNSSGYLSSVSLSATSPNQLTKIPFTLDTTDNIYLSFHYNLPSSEVNIKITYTIVQDSVTTPKFDTYFEPYIKNCGIKNIMKNVIYGSTSVDIYSKVVAFGANVYKNHKYYLQYEIFKEGLSNLYGNPGTPLSNAVLPNYTSFSTNVGIHSYSFKAVNDYIEEDSPNEHLFGILTNKSGGLQLEGNGVSDYIGNFILVDCTGIETPKETLPSNLEYNQYYIKTSDNTLINLGTEPLRQNDIANTNGERINRRYKINLYDFVDKLWRRNVAWSEKGDFELWYCIIDKATTFKYAEGDENSLCAELPHVNIINTATTNSYRIGTIDTEKNVLYLCINRNELNDNTEASIKEWISNHRYNIEYDIETELKERNPQNAIRALPTGLSFTDYHKDNITNTMTTITTPTANFPEDINSLVNPIMNYNINNINITIPYTLRSIKENNVSDYIKVEKGKVIFVQCVGEITFNGSENWVINARNFVNYSTISRQKVSNSAYSNLYKNKSTIQQWNTLNDNMFMVTTAGLTLIRDDFFNLDVNLFKNYLKQNPLTIQYILETPIETDITNTEFGNNILQFIRNDFKGGDSYFTLNDSNNNLVHLKYYSTDYQENGEPTTAEKDPITNRYTILIQPIIDNKGVSADVDWVKKEVIY